MAIPITINCECGRRMHADLGDRGAASAVVAPGRSADVRCPSATFTEPGPAPCRGDCSSPTVKAISCSRSAVPAAWTAELTMPAPAEPTAAVLFGRSLSPAWNSMSRRATPRASAPTCVAMVRTPVPNSCVEVCTIALPSATIRARARCGGMKNAIGYAAAATPVPTSHSPSRVDRRG